MKKIVFILIALMVSSVCLICRAQSRIRSESTPVELPDSADLEYYGHRDFKQAALTVTGLNLAVWANDRYIQNSDFAHISFESIKDNFKEGFNWDNDFLGTNMFLHPYHGSLYFNSGRANGFNYWQSGLFAFGGSAMWELFFENEYPSTNDIIATPIGGMAIGEVTFRASDIVLKDNTRGWERFGREAAAFLIAPTRGLTRIINGDAWRYRSTSGRQFGIPHIDAELSAGVRAVGIKHNVLDCGAGFATELNIEYGDRFELSSAKPYDYFKFRVNLNVERSQPLLAQLSIMGRLFNRELIDTKTDDLSIGMYQHFDFYDSDTLSEKSAKVPYKLGIPASVGGGVIYHSSNRGNVEFDAHTHLNAVLLGGILSDHYEVKDRNYNLASGFSIKSGFNFVFGKDKFSFSADYDYFRLFTWGYPRNLDIHSVDSRTLNAEGDESVAYFGVARFRADLKVAPRIFLTGTFNTYSRVTRYRDFPNVHSTSFSTRLMLTYKF